MLHIKLHMPAGVHAFMVKYYCRGYASYTSCDFFTLVSALVLNRGCDGHLYFKRQSFKWDLVFIHVCFISADLDIASNTVCLSGSHSFTYLKCSY